MNKLPRLIDLGQKRIHSYSVVAGGNHSGVLFHKFHRNSKNLTSSYETENRLKSQIPKNDNLGNEKSTNPSIPRFFPTDGKTLLEQLVDKDLETALEHIKKTVHIRMARKLYREILHSKSIKNGIKSGAFIVLFLIC